MEHFVVFSNTVPYEEETNMAVAIMMTCKISLIWRHMKTVYWYNYSCFFDRSFTKLPTEEIELP